MSEFIRELKPNQVFVFGSNTQGRHGAGAAKQAMKFGAVYGQPSGLQGQTYAIITKDLTSNKRYPLEKIQIGLVEFVKFAIANPQLEFLVTELGCGLAGYSIEIIGLLFPPVPDNVKLPTSFGKINYHIVQETLNVRNQQKSIHSARY